MARCNFGDLYLKQAKEENFSQVVMLGAGNDTRFHRMKDELDPTIALFEVDAPKSQEFKVRRMSKIFMYKILHARFATCLIDASTTESSLYLLILRLRAGWLS